MTSEQAFKALRKQVNEEIEAVRNANQELMRTNHFTEARKLAEKGEKLSLLKEEVNSLNRKWRRYFPQEETLPGIDAAMTITRGMRTPENAFYIPILKVLVEMNGRGTTSEVVDRVGQMMSGILNEFDNGLLQDGNIRWRNTTLWAKNNLKNKGFVTSRERGFWEITQEGREYLKSQGG